MVLLRDPSTVAPDPAGLSGYVALRINVRDPAALDAFDAGRFDEIPTVAASTRRPLTLQIAPALAGRVVRAADSIPELTVVIDHMGSPGGPDDPGIESLIDAATVPRVAIKRRATWTRGPRAHPLVRAQPREPVRRSEVSPTGSRNDSVRCIATSGHRNESPRSRRC